MLKEMRTKLKTGAAIDLSDAPRAEDGCYVIEHFDPSKDYCDLLERRWFTSIARRRSDGVIHGHLTADLHNRGGYEGLWLR